MPDAVKSVHVHAVMAAEITAEIGWAAVDVAGCRWGATP
jgi:hypothetical protein